MMNHEPITKAKIRIRIQDKDIYGNGNELKRVEEE